MWTNVQAQSQFAETIVIDDNQSTILKLTGVSTRKKFALDIYDIAHYSDAVDTQEHVNTQSNLYDTILSTKGNKQVSLIFQRSLRAAQIQKALTKGVKNNCMGDEIHLVEAALQDFRNVINKDVAKNDEFSLRWTEDGTLLAFFKGENIGQFDSPLLARLLWSMWFGESAVVERTDLVQQLLIASNSIE